MKQKYSLAIRPFIITNRFDDTKTNYKMLNKKRPPQFGTHYNPPFKKSTPSIMAHKSQKLKPCVKTIPEDDNLRK